MAPKGAGKKFAGKMGGKRWEGWEGDPGGPHRWNQKSLLGSVAAKPLPRTIYQPLGQSEVARKEKRVRGARSQRASEERISENESEN